MENALEEFVALLVSSPALTMLCFVLTEISVIYHLGNVEVNFIY